MDIHQSYPDQDLDIPATHRTLVLGATTVFDLRGWDVVLNTIDPTHRLATLFILTRRAIQTATDRMDPIPLTNFVEANGAWRILNLPAARTLYTRPDYTDLFLNGLRKFVRDCEATTGEMTYVAQHDLIRDLAATVTAQRAHWRRAAAAHRAAQGITREILTAAVWAPRRLERWLEMAGDDEAAREAVFNGFETAAD